MVSRENYPNIALFQTYFRLISDLFQVIYSGVLINFPRIILKVILFPLNLELVNWWMANKYKQYKVAPRLIRTWRCDQEHGLCHIDLFDLVSSHFGCPWNGGFLKLGHPQIIHVHRIFHYKPSSYCTPITMDPPKLVSRWTSCRAQVQVRGIRIELEALEQAPGLDPGEPWLSSCWRNMK